MVLAGVLEEGNEDGEEGGEHPEVNVGDEGHAALHTVVPGKDSMKLLGHQSVQENVKDMICHFTMFEETKGKYIQTPP